MSGASFILGISAYYHDSAAVLLADDRIIGAAQEERFSRKKHDDRFPTNAISYLLEEAGITLNDLSAVVFYDKPFLKFERLLETYHTFAPRGLRSFLKALPVWVKEKIFLKTILKRELNALNKGGLGNCPVLFTEHHLSHAASAFYPSPFETAGILTIDGVGEWATLTIGKGEGRHIDILKEIHFPHSLGLFYSALTYYCGFKVNSGEYKVMGLAPYGNLEDPAVSHYKQLMLDHLIDVRDDGSFLLNMAYFDYATGLRMCCDQKWESLFKLKKRASETALTQDYMNLALAAQQVTEEIVLKCAKTTQELTGCKQVVLAGGVALNCVANGKLLRSGIFDDVWVQPAAGDAGGALGAAYAGYHIYLDKDRHPIKEDAMQGSYLGPSFESHQMRCLLDKYGIEKGTWHGDEILCEKVAALLATGNIVGWFQGRMEWGPRALGNRRILADPRDKEMQKRLNLKIKKREGFRPFAPSVSEENVQHYFDIEKESPYMSFVAPVTEQRRQPLPDAYHKLDLYPRLYVQRSDLPAITHIDYSARLQTVKKTTNPLYWRLLQAFKKETGIDVLINTSFNVRGEPIVCTPENAWHCFLNTDMDILVLGGYIVLKSELDPGILAAFKEKTFQLD